MHRYGLGQVQKAHFMLFYNLDCPFIPMNEATSYP